MNQKIKKLAEDAGFCYWQDESWGPGPGHIDWGCSYDEEFKKYTEALITECAEIAFCNAHCGGSDISVLIRDYFGIE